MQPRRSGLWFWLGLGGSLQHDGGNRLQPALSLLDRATFIFSTNVRHEAGLSYGQNVFYEAQQHLNTDRIESSIIPEEGVLTLAHFGIGCKEVSSSPGLRLTEFTTLASSVPSFSASSRAFTLPPCSVRCWRA